MQKELQNYATAKAAALTTTEIIKDSFKNAFKKQDDNGFVIVKNNRREEEEEESVLISMGEYLKMVKIIDKLQEDLFDIAAGKIDLKNYEFTDARELDL